MLIKKPTAFRNSHRGRINRKPCPGQTDGLDRRTFLRRSGLAGGALAALGTLPVGSVRKAEAAAVAGRRTPQVTIRKSICTHCAVGCTVTAEVPTGCGSAGAELGFARSIAARIVPRAPRCANCVHRRAAAQISDEARQRPMDAHQLGPGDRRDRRQANGDPRKVGPRFGLLARLGQDHQRRRLSVPQTRARSGAPTTPTIRRASAIRRPSPA